MLNRRYQQRGVTIIESMIALLVISVGLLGIAALQLTSMKQNNTALQNSKAVWIAYTMADRVRANSNVFVNYVGVNTEGDYNQQCTAAPCSALEMVDADADDWIDEVSVLPSGYGEILGNANTLTITVMWDDEGTNPPGRACGPDPDVDLTCYRVTLTQ